MILYPTDRKLLRTLRRAQTNETSYLYISPDYTFCVPLELPEPELIPDALDGPHYKFHLEPPQVQGALYSLESNSCIYHPSGQYVHVTSYGWRWKYLSNQNMKLLLLQSVLSPIIVSVATTILTYLILLCLKG